MKLIVSHSDIDTNPALFLRSAGYTYIESRHTGQESFARPLGSGHYPRFHVYVNETGEKLVFNIHLDQKRASYEGTAAHAGEYDGETVAAEVARLRSLLRPSGSSRRPSRSPSEGGLPPGDERARRFSDLIHNM